MFGRHMSLCSFLQQNFLNFLFCSLFLLNRFMFWYRWIIRPRRHLLEFGCRYSIMLWKWGQCQFVCVSVRERACVVTLCSCPCFACLEGLHLANPRPLLCYVVSFNYRLTLWPDCGKTQCLITLSTDEERRKPRRKYLCRFKCDTTSFLTLHIT